MLRDGTRYRIDNGGVTWMRDRNGNKLSFSTSGSSTIITGLAQPHCDYHASGFRKHIFRSSYSQGFGGATRTILVTYAQLTNALRTTNPRGEPSGRIPDSDVSRSFSGVEQRQLVHFWNPWVVASVTLPNNKQYQLKYNCFAELARINLPTGGAIEYDYTAGSGVIGDGDDYQVFRRVLERRLYPDGANLETYTTYDGSGSGVQADQRSANGTLLSREKHYYYGGAAASLLTLPELVIRQTGWPGIQDRSLRATAHAAAQDRNNLG